MTCTAINHSTDFHTMTEPTPKRQQTTKPKKTWIINAFENAASGHQFPGQWKSPEDQSKNYKDLEYWTSLAQLLEKGKFHSVFIGDALTIYDDYRGSETESGHNLAPALTSGLNVPKNEPSAPVTAMAAVTKNLGFGLTFSTISEHPYHFARRLATLDHLTKGRIGWNIVSSYLNSTARQLLNGGPLPEHDERYIKTEEYVQIVYKLLLSSWRDDAVVYDLKREFFADPDLVREINHVGKYFNVPGPAINEPIPQGFPLVIQAGTSSKGKLFAAENAEVVFVGGRNLKILKKSIADIKYLAVEKFGRDPNHIKFLTQITPILGKTHEEAQEKFDDILKYVDLEGAQALFAGWTGIDLSEYEWDEELKYVKSNGMRSLVDNLTKNNPDLKVTRRSLAQDTAIGGSTTKEFIGTPQEVADTLEAWVEETGLDGFNFAYARWPGTFKDIVELLIPELQKRGVAQTEYSVNGGTFRENVYGLKGQTYLPKDHPFYKLRWSNGLSKDEFEQELKIFQKERDEKYERIIKELKEEGKL
ncbi:putative monooxygenase [Wickerhamomyces ciferrii]|uniref:Monooxygenase n=1 Tax=Wickerhamomyces ciferrii (strain ATCC 14091 / BCRC 22168 / CBS 111 / JCM 3599 / NBRC 0793 / NRRL Y-1031 F-60-10) TaxID=1206466 RepID=K0KSF1_WICCF|nr:putative monooxygenase [Wickerhamomyces ciferrii]CCH46096.1 putative monooxygenase [Wickerhamomyces ciferrii]